MKKFLIVVALVVMSAVLVLASEQKFVVDDFTGGKAESSIGGWWYIYNDASSGGNSEVTPAPNKFEMVKLKNTYVASMQGKTGNKLGWDFVGMGVTLGMNCGCPGKAEPVDLSKFTNLTLKIRGSITGGRITVILPYSDNKCVDEKTSTLTDWADYEVALNSKLSKEWTIVKLNLKNDFKQAKWAKTIVPIEKVLENAHSIDFHFTSSDGDKVDFQVGSIEFN